MDAPPRPPRRRVDVVRRFSRFYTRLLGVLSEGLLRTPYSLAEARVIWELAHRERLTATMLAEHLALDPGYLSRILRKLETNGLVVRTPSEADARQHVLALTDRGRDAFTQLDTASRLQVEELLLPLSDDAQRRVIAAMETVESFLDAADHRPVYTLRGHRPGDMGYIVHRQAALYHREYGWDESYEALIARIVADFIDHFDSARERCWVAERDGEIVGSVFIVRHPEREGVARLRLLYVEPSARGTGLGRRLVRECTRFARDAGYHTITLWTNSVLVSARRIYEAEGYELVKEEPHHSFGKDLVGQTWELVL